MKIGYLFIAIILTGCIRSHSPNDLFSIQLLDRNGLHETISVKERLKAYEKINFNSPQPYQKVIRVYGKTEKEKTCSKISTYHRNGFPWQYLEVEDGRAFGQYIEWYDNGSKKLEATVIAGTPDVHEMAQMTWLFDGMSYVYDEQGFLLAEIPYDKGFLQGFSRYYHPNGGLAKEIFYKKDVIDGTWKMFNPEGSSIEEISYENGQKHGHARGYWKEGVVKYIETYEKDHLISGEYFDQSGHKTSSIENGEGEKTLFENTETVTMEYHDGLIAGSVKTFNLKGFLLVTTSMKNHQKNGEELHYYPSFEKQGKVKLSIHWQNDQIEGAVKTWYPSGHLESEREFHANQKHGRSFAWFDTGDLMLIEDYENDRLMKGLYFKKGTKDAVSQVSDGCGIATVFDSNGLMIKKIHYKQGVPQDDH